ncbi:MAG: nucleotide sugar dehydrogenase [Acidobacteriota bacterium]|nr:nucleotide sugar dehydrogenase [Acidobacteriota bacterium]
MTTVAPDHVVVLGQGYVGLPLAVAAAEAGHTVVGYEPDPRRLAMLRSRRSYVEDISDARLADVSSCGYRATDRPEDLTGFDVAVIAVPTPLRDRVPDLSAVEDASRALGPFLRPGATVVLESTTYPGTTEEIVGPILEEGSGLVAGRDFHLGYSSERIDPGNPKWSVVNTPKLVSGIDETSTKTIADFYSTVVDRVVPVSRPAVAELAKLIENTFRHVNIALVNELAMFANELGIDIGEAIDAAATKPFGFMRFDPGPGVGGHCLPIDPTYLSWRVRSSLNRSFRFVELANDINDHMPEYVARRLADSLNRRCRSLNGARVLLLGLAYKRNSGDCRESPAVTLASLLLSAGAEVRAADPHVVEQVGLPGLTRVEPTADELAGADVVVLVTDHDAFDLDQIRAHSKFVFDTRRRLQGTHVESL